ncbi:MAG: protein jag [Oscillospiraceae bacterium]|nr:protein jag [Oscillospiraceae bacterium]
MEKTIVTTGKTIDLAIEAALNQLGLDRDSVSVQVLAQAKSGFLGLGGQPAKVQVTYEAPDPVPEAPKVALSSASRSKPKAAPAAPKKPEPPKPVQQEAPKAAPAPKAEPKKEAPKPAERKPEVKKEAPAAPAEPKVYAPAEPGSVEEKIEVFLKGLLEHMDSDAVPHAWKAEGNTYKVAFTGSDLGFLIGRRGETLDALQHLANCAVGRNVDGHIRISVDAEDYREKREESLRRYARKKAQQVLKNRRRCSLEPMNAYERHVIHAALQDMENITTHSTGTEPNRRVVIEYVK